MQRLRSKDKDVREQITKLKYEAEIQAQAGCVTTPSSDAAHSSFDVGELSNITEGWQGLQETGQIYYGPLSSSYFVTRITRYLSQALNQPIDNAKLEACIWDIHGLDYHYLAIVSALQMCLLKLCAVLPALLPCQTIK
jgi:hypothetical protein